MTESWIRTLAQTAQATEAGLVGWRVERLRQSLEGPLAIVGAGAMRTATMLWAQLHERSGHPAWAMTPYQLMERGIPKGTRVLFLSVSGRNHDMLRAVRFTGERGVAAHAVVFNSGSPLVAMLREAGPDSGIMLLPAPDQRDSLTTIHSLVSMSVLAASVNEGGGPWAPSFFVQRQPMPPERPGHVIVLGVGDSQPAAFDFAARCRSTGFAPAHVTDLRDFAHGDLMTVRADDTWLVAFASGAQGRLVKRALSYVPAEIPRVLFETSAQGATAALELMSRSMVGFVELAERMNMTADSVSKPGWTSKLFFMPIDSDP